MIKEILGFRVKISYKQNMRNIKFRFQDGIIIISCPKISDKRIEKYLKDNYDFFKENISNSIKTSNHTYIHGVKYNIITTKEKFNNIIFESDSLIITEGSEHKLIENFFINDVNKFIELEHETLEKVFNVEMPKFIIKN